MQKPFKVTEIRDNGGILQHKAMVKYGTSMLSLAQAHPLFVNGKNWDQYKDGIDGLQSARPIITKDVISTFNGISISDAIDKYKTTNEGKELLAYSENVNGEKVTILRPLPDINTLKSNNINMSTKNILLDIKEGWSAKYLDSSGNTVLLSFENPMLERALILPENGRITTDKLPMLFSLKNGEVITYSDSNNEKLDAYIGINPAEYKIGLASAGYDDEVFLVQRVVVVVWLSVRLSYRFGVLTKNEAIKQSTLVGAKVTKADVEAKITELLANLPNMSDVQIRQAVAELNEFAKNL